MTELSQLSTGMITGLASGLSLALLRPLVRLIVGLGLLGAAFVFYRAGMPGLLVLFQHFASQVRLYPVFFAAMAIGKLVGVAFAGGRR